MSPSQPAALKLDHYKRQCFALMQEDAGQTTERLAEQGFSLHAAVRCDALERPRLEWLCR